MQRMWRNGMQYGTWGKMAIWCQLRVYYVGSSLLTAPCNLSFVDQRCTRSTSLVSLHSAHHKQLLYWLTPTELFFSFLLPKTAASLTIISNGNYFNQWRGVLEAEQCRGAAALGATFLRTQNMCFWVRNAILSHGLGRAKCIILCQNLSHRLESAKCVLLSYNLNTQPRFREREMCAFGLDSQYLAIC